MSVLQKIFDERRTDLERAKAEVPWSEIEEWASRQEPPRGFLRSLRQSPRRPALIAEIKPASPSQGEINRHLDAAEVARQYEAAGAQCLSVLTEPLHFGGSLANLQAAREASVLPVLRKDFIDDPYRIAEARAWGADAILLIVAALEEEQLADLMAETARRGMDALVEVHDEAEMETALRCEAPLIGVNSRNLATLETDLAVSVRLLPIAKGRALTVAESALSTRADVERVAAAGADAVLIGTAFCAAPDIVARVGEVMPD